MTVSSETRRADYLGDGATTDFATGFRFLQDQDLKVIVTVTATGVESEKVLNTDYTVTGSGLDAGGTVTMNTAPISGEKLTILRNLAITQETDYVENDPFPAESHERALDKLTMIVQQQQDDIDRSLKLQESETSTGLTVPPPSVGLFLQWDSSGNLQNTDIANQGNIAITNYGRTLVASPDAAAARGVLETPSVTDLNNSADPFAIDTGVVNAIVVDYTPDLNVSIDGRQFRVRVVASNTVTNPSINIDGAGPLTITKNGGQPLSVGDIPTEAIFRRDSTNARIELINPAKTPVQLASASSSALVTTSSAMPNDNTIPQSSEGVEFLTVAITPRYANSKLLILVNSFGDTSLSRPFSGALFLDNNSDAFYAQPVTPDPNNAGTTTPFNLMTVIDAVDTSPRTYRLRMGPNAGSTLTINGINGSEVFGSISTSTMSVMEIPTS